MVWILLFAGLLSLVLGAEALVRGSSRLAASLGVAPLIIGLTVVAFGTSAPELAVSLKASLAGQAEVAVGNVIGSNIFNVLFILGVSALLVPLVVSVQLIRWDVPLMIVASVAVWGMGLDGRIGRGEGVLLVAALVAYTLFLIRQARREKASAVQEFSDEFAGPAKGKPVRWGYELGRVVVGLVLLVLGSGWLVDGAVLLARSFGVSELMIGLTIVAVGTSLPEVVTSIVASLRGEREIAVGNVVGSNLFNLLGVLGLASAVAPRGIPIQPAALGFDLPIMVAVAAACLPIFFTGHRISRWEGGLFLGYYGVYLGFLILKAVHSEILPTLTQVLLLVVLPLTLLPLAVGVVRSWRGGAGGRLR